MDYGLGDTIHVDKSVPCYKCESRFCGCHTSCEAYKTWKATHDEEKEEQRVKNFDPAGNYLAGKATWFKDRRNKKRRR